MKTRSLLFGLIALFLSFVTIPAFAQNNLVTETPQYKIGDTWTYTSTNLSNNTRISTYTDTVKKIDGDVVFFQKVNKRGIESEMLTTLEGNVISVAGNTVTPYFPTFSFPMNTSKKWEKDYETTHTSDGAKTAGTLKAEVISYEKVTVPAGTFDAFKTEYYAFYQRVDGTSRHGKFINTYWYAPSAKRFVKEEATSFSARGSLMDHTLTQLEEFTLKE